MSSDSGIPVKHEGISYEELLNQLDSTCPRGSGPFPLEPPTYATTPGSHVAKSGLIISSRSSVLLLYVGKIYKSAFDKYFSQCECCWFFPYTNNNLIYKNTSETCTFRDVHFVLGRKKSKQLPATHPLLLVAVVTRTCPPCQRQRTPTAPHLRFKSQLHTEIFTVTWLPSPTDGRFHSTSFTHSITHQTRSHLKHPLKKETSMS